MLLVDSNIFIYARGNHAYSRDCQDFIEAAIDKNGWFVPLLVLLELTHYYRDDGEYARGILAGFPGAQTTIEDFRWAIDQSDSHADINDHVILHSAQRLSCAAVVSYDQFFADQSFFTQVDQLRPTEVT